MASLGEAAREREGITGRPHIGSGHRQRHERMLLRHTGWDGLNKGRASVMRAAVFVVDGHDIDLYPDAEGAAREIEGYDATNLDYLGSDGTVYTATVDGPEWGPITLHRTQDNRLDDLIRLLRAEAEDRGLSLPPETPDDPEAIWGALLAAQQEQQEASRSRRRWWKRRAQDVLPKE